jgi:hypothetical protein
MIASFTLILICAVVFFGFWLTALALRVDMRRLEQLEKYFEKYKRAINNMFKHDVEFPSAILNELEYWNEAVSEKGFSRKVAVMLVRANFDKRVNRRLEDTNDERQKFFMKYPDIEAEYMKVVLYALVASSFQAPLWGVITRSAAVELFDDNKPKDVDRFTESVRRGVRVSRNSNRTNLDGAVPSAA